MPGVLMTAEDERVLDDWDGSFGGNDRGGERRGGRDGGGANRGGREHNRRGQPHGNRRHNHRDRSAKLMTSDEIEQILRIQWAATHPMDRSAYEHDYYYQNWLSVTNKSKLKEPFAPETLREVAPQAKEARAPTAFVTLQGLGRVPFSNIRAPKPIVDMKGDGAAEGAAGRDAADGAQGYGGRRLEQEPLLAARIMIEDGMCLLLDVDDIDRQVEEGIAAEAPAAMSRRRDFLLEGLAGTIRLPAAPVLTPQARKRGDSDAVFESLTALHKGRVMLAKLLPRLRPGCAAAASLVWAVMRHAPAMLVAGEKAAAAAAAAAGTGGARVSAAQRHGVRHRGAGRRGCGARRRNALSGVGGGPRRVARGADHRRAGAGLAAGHPGRRLRQLPRVVRLLHRAVRRAGRAPRGAGALRRRRQGWGQKGGGGGEGGGGRSRRRPGPAPRPAARVRPALLRGAARGDPQPHPGVPVSARRRAVSR